MVSAAKGWQVARLASLLGVIIILISCTRVEDHEMKKAFQAYKALFIDNGRVVDTGNEDVSHSEGQGYGLLFAVAANDKASFDSIWSWTKRVLQRSDNLFHWRYRPCESRDKQCIDDLNNASDGDLLIAWALLRAADKWGNRDYRESAESIIRALESRLIAQYGDYAVLLPGEYGFNETNSVQINLSYWIFPAIDQIANVSSNSAQWIALYDSGIALIHKAQFSRHQLPPDWLRITQNTLSLEGVLSQGYGFNACRIPLHLAWAGINAPAVYSSFKRWWRLEETPATLNLVSNNVAEYSMTPGMEAVASTVMHIIEGETLKLPLIDRNMDYYSASLTLLSMVAIRDSKH